MDFGRNAPAILCRAVFQTMPLKNQALCPIMFIGSVEP